ncbi:MAG: hypothetical protein IJH39_00020 [Clostridia bacterium]|nr:hypothetical protein [Clostridia bacterium]
MNKITKEPTINQYTKKRKAFMIGNLSLWKLFAYFVVYSIAGFIIETIFGIVRTRLFRKQTKFFIWSILRYIWLRCMCYDYNITIL